MRAAASGSTSWRRPSAPAPPGSRRLEPGEGLWIHGPLGRPFSAPSALAEGAPGAILVGGGIGVAPLAIWRRQLLAAGVPARILLGFRDRPHSGGLELFDCSEIRLASEDGHSGHRGYVTDLLAVLLEGDDAGSAAVYACGPPAMLEAVRMLCADRGVACELAMEAPMACGFGACFGCAIPLGRTGGVHAPLRGWARRARRRDRRPLWCQGRAIDASSSAASSSATRSSTARAPSTRSRRGEPSAISCSTQFPFSAFVSKTITPEPRVGNPPPRLWETPQD